MSWRRRKIEEIRCLGDSSFDVCMICTTEDTNGTAVSEVYDIVRGGWRTRLCEGEDDKDDTALENKSREE